MLGIVHPTLICAIGIVWHMKNILLLSVLVNQVRLKEVFTLELFMATNITESVVFVDVSNPESNLRMCDFSERGKPLE